MTKTESTIRFLFGASRKDIRPLVHAVDITIKLMFSQGIPMDDIRVTHAVYPQVAKRLKRVPVHLPLPRQRPGGYSGWPMRAGTPSWKEIW